MFKNVDSYNSIAYNVEALADVPAIELRQLKFINKVEQC
jgi:hypothetical protein